MKKAILLIVVILVTLGAAVFTYTHSQKFNRLQRERLDTIADNDSVKADIAVTKKNLSDETKALAAAETEKEEVTQRVTTLESEGADLKRKGEDLDAKIKSQEQEFVELQKTLDEVSKILANLGADITLDNLGDKMAEIDADKKAKVIKLDETEAQIASTEKSLATNRAEADRLAKRIIERSARIGRNAMEAVVTAVDQDWGFLVIGAGSNSGFTPQTDLLVMRDGRLIGRVRPSSIEPTQTIAEIDLASLAPGVRLQPGDRVILRKPTSN